jgi:hypothetical protein
MPLHPLRCGSQILVLAATVSVASCYHQYVTVAHPDMEVRPSSKTVYSYAWGLIHSKDTVAVCPETNAIHELEVRANFGQTMLGLITLGIVVPRRVTWHCGNPQEPIDGIGAIGDTRTGEIGDTVRNH